MSHSHHKEKCCNSDCNDPCFNPTPIFSSCGNFGGGFGSGTGSWLWIIILVAVFFFFFNKDKDRDRDRY